MTPQDAINLLRLIREHREWDEQGEAYMLDADKLEQAVLDAVDDEPPAA